ncbi:protein-export chaperone SecB [Phaeospirillum tilakii]|uniref:Protein-export protein SecB n=1 Tax=Phaeospirillum tilakii TaxID=741673 RepID=A0ABW5CGM3_9PROT
MTETPQDDTAPSLKIHGQYIKDLSFEVPGAPQVFFDGDGQAPDIALQVDVNATPVAEGAFEVVLRLRTEARAGEKTLFIAELDYAGLFSVQVPEEHLGPCLLIECPRLLFPYARAIVASLTRDSGFPPLALQPLDFVALYRARLEQQAAGNA